MMMFDKIWLKLSQAIALIDEEFPRLQSESEKLPIDTIRIFVLETRTDLLNFNEAIKYVENIEKKPSRKPDWFKFDPEILDE